MRISSLFHLLSAIFEPAYQCVDLDEYEDQKLLMKVDILWKAKAKPKVVILDKPGDQRLLSFVSFYTTEQRMTRLCCILLQLEDKAQKLKLTPLRA